MTVAVAIPAAAKSSSSRPRLLIATAGVGAGHNAVAQTIRAAIRERWPAIDVRIVDVLDLVPTLLRSVVISLNSFAMMRLPWLFGRLYHASDRSRSSSFTVGERLGHVVVGRLLFRFRTLVEEFRPDVILHTHWYSIMVLSAGQTSKQVCSQQAVVVTDILAHRYWYSPHTDRWFVAAPETIEKLKVWGVNEASVTVSGIPVHHVWDGASDSERIRNEWSLPAGRAVVLLTGGATITVGRIPELAQRLHSTCPGAVVVVLCGTNRRLYSRLQQLPAAGSTLFAIPFTDRAHELVSIASLFVTKSGGVTTAECLAAGVPMLLLPPLPGQEAENAAWLEKQGAAVVARSTQDVVLQVRRLLDDEPARRSLAKSARALHRNGREMVLTYVEKRLGLS